MVVPVCSILKYGRQKYFPVFMHADQFYLLFFVEKFVIDAVIGFVQK